MSVGGRIRAGVRRVPGATGFVHAWRADSRELVRRRLTRRNERALLGVQRADRDVCWVEGDDDAEPLVTIAIPTYRRPDELMRAVEAALGQTYERIEVLVIGDATDAESAKRVTSTGDPRVRFVNLAYPGIYPADRDVRWLVAGTKPMNVAIDLARGAWLASCDDDDELLPNAVETLLGAAKRRRLEMVHGRYEQIDYPPADLPAGTPPVVTLGGQERMVHATVARGAVLYSMGLRFLHYDPEAWRVGDPADWNLWRRMQVIGVRYGFHPEPVYRYHRHVPSGEHPPEYWGVKPD